MSQEIVYKTFELNTDVEHKAKPINLSGATTIKLTNIPSNVKCWISTESNGTNLYPLINRGDGWVNLPNPLYNLYIYTEGTTIDNQKILLNYTGQNDFFEYGNNSSERIDKVGLLEGFSPRALMELNNAIYNLYNKPKLIKSINIQGEYYEVLAYNSPVSYMCLPLDGGIAGLNLQDDKFYKLEFFGHIDNGGGNGDDNSNYSSIAINTHLCLFNNTNNATFTPATNFDIDNFYKLNKTPWASEKTDLFDIWGMKYKSFHRYTENITQIDTGFQDYGLNFNDNMIFSGETIKKYENIGLKIGGGGGGGGDGDGDKYSVYMHSSLIINLYEMQDPTQWKL